MNVPLAAIAQIPLRQTLYVIQVVLEEALFAVHFKRKSSFAVRLTVALLLYIAVSLITFLLLNPIFTHNLFIIFLLSIGLMFLCFDNRPSDILFSCFSAITVQNLAYNTGLLCCMAFNIPPDIDSGLPSKLLQAAVFMVVNVICYFACVRKASRADTFGDCRRALIAIATVVFLIIYILETYMDLIGMLYFGVVRVLFVICDIMVLLLLYWIFERYQAEQERKVLKDMISMQHSQFEMSKKTMEIINMKEHDLKHLLTVLRNEDTIHQSRTYLELEEAASRFERSIQTGNQAMDIILTEKNLLCRSHEITMTYMIDPTGLDRLQVEDMAAIFGNLLDNAIRYLQTVEDKEKRLLHLQIQNTAGLLMIHVENYCETAPAFYDGLPITTQADRAAHGFGLKSVRYLIETYGGAMSVTAEHQIFQVDLTVPMI